ncbi:hypothetical protein J6X96_06570 [bacterium]|nr:hypothetical protein [bacterium]
MSRILLFSVIFFAAAAFGAEVYYTCDFEEGFTPGDLQGQKNWTVRTTDGYCHEDNVATVGDYHSRQCVQIGKATGWNGVIVKNIPPSPNGSLVKVSFKMFWPNDSSVSSVQIASDWWNRPVQLSFKSNDGGTFRVGSLQDKTTLVPEDIKNVSFGKGEWIDVSYTIDFRAGVMDKLKVGEKECDASLVPIKDSSTNLKSFSIVADAEANICFDDIKVESIDREGSPVLAIGSVILLVPSKSTAASLPLYNMGGGELTYRVYLDEQPEWLTIKNPEGTFTESAALNFSFDRSLMQTNVYYVNVRVDGGSAGSKTCLLKVQSKGAICSYTFDPPALYSGEITGQDGWEGIRDDGYGYLDNCMLVTNVPYGADGPCGFIKNAYGWNSYTCPVTSEKDAVVKVSMKIRKDSESSQDSFYFRNEWWSFLYEFWFWRYEDAFYLYKFNSGKAYAVAGDYPFPLDTWLDLSFTIDLRLYRLTEFSLGGFSTNFTSGFELMTQHDKTNRYEKLNTLAFVCGSAEVTDANLLVDDILVVELERPKTPIPLLDTSVALDPTQERVSVPVMNAGNRAFKYTLTVLDLPQNLVPQPATGKVGASGDLTFDLFTDSLEDGFYRTRVVMDYKATSGSGEGSITSLFTFAKGGWYYATEFEGSWYEPGGLRGQDTWLAGVEGSGKEPKVSAKEGAQCAELPGTGYIKTSCFVPPESAFTFKSRFFVENGDDEGYAKVSFIDDTGFMPFYICRDREIRKAVLGYFPAGSDTFENLAQANMGEWQNFSFSIDTNLERNEVLSVTFGDTEITFPEGTFFLNNEYDTCAVSNLTIRVSSGSEEEETVAPFYFDNIVVHDNAVPEPLAGLFFAALALFNLRKK